MNREKTTITTSTIKRAATNYYKLHTKRKGKKLRRGRLEQREKRKRAKERDEGRVLY